MDYEEIGYREAKLVRLDVLVAGEPVDALSMLAEQTAVGERDVMQHYDGVQRTWSP